MSSRSKRSQESKRSKRSKRSGQHERSERPDRSEPEPIELELVWAEGDIERARAEGLAALARFLIQAYERGLEGSLDSSDAGCHAAERLDRERQLPVEPDRDRPNQEV